MVPDNYYIADQFSLLARLMDIHGENSFKAKSYAAAAFNIEKLPDQLSNIAPEKVSALKGVGDSAAKKIAEILQSGKLKALEDLVIKTPPGVIEMLNIKGIGPKKISTVWKEMGIESLGELLYACQENRLLLYKGFGAKTQQNVMEAIEFYMKNQDSFLYADVEAYATEIDKGIKAKFSNYKFEQTGEFRRCSEIINQLEWITTAPIEALKSFYSQNNFEIIEESKNLFSCKGPQNVRLQFLNAEESDFHDKLLQTSCSEEFLAAWKNIEPGRQSLSNTEASLFESRQINFIPSFLREDPSIIEIARNDKLDNLIEVKDVKAIIHSHSNWSDGVSTPEDMARACITRGYEYLVLSDHSKSAFYANGLSEERIKEQHRYIEELNEKLKPFKIFKSIECDILNDGTLDYSDNVLSTFDLVITSIHANLKMTEDKAMTRLLNAIKNPYTTILGHMTGRLLLSRKGYPVNHEQIIDACIENNVVIELNAHPRRLDIDWRWIMKATSKGALISIDPDAHSIEGYDDIRYGVIAARKGALVKEKNLSSFNLEQFENFLAELKKKKGI